MKHVDPAPAHKTHSTNRASDSFREQGKVVFLIRCQTRKVTTCVKRETSPKTWQWPKGTWKDALSISHQGDANQNLLSYHLTPTKTAIIKKDSKQVSDAAINIHVKVFCMDIHSSSQGQISKNYWVMWWLLNLRNKSSRTILHSPQPWTRSAMSLHPHQDLFTVFFWYLCPHRKFAHERS